MMTSSCSPIIKGLIKSVANNYDDQKEMNVSSLQLTDSKGKTSSLGDLYAGKTVYMYVWKLSQLVPPGDSDSAYVGLKRRFAKYDDVVFINVYTGDKKDDSKLGAELKNKNVESYSLTKDDNNTAFRELLGPSTSPQIVGKDGFILGFKGPRPTDKLVVDYALFEARSGINATKSTKKLIKGMNREGIKDAELNTWYEGHFGKKAGKDLSISISGDKSNIDTGKLSGDK